MTKILLVLISILAVVFIILGVNLLYSNWQAEKLRLPPEAPRELVASPLSSTRIQLNWKDNSNNELGFILYRDGEKIAILPENTRKHIDENLRPATSYNYEIKAYNMVAESDTIGYSVKTLNPSIQVWLERVGVHENGEEGESFRELWDLVRGQQVTGEIQFGFVVTDGKNTYKTSFPNKGYYELKQDDVVNIRTLLFSGEEVGEYLRVFATAYEQDGGFQEEVIYKALDFATGSYIGNPTSLILTLAGVDLSKIYADIAGAEDDWLGTYDNKWTSDENWGVNKYVDVNCKRGNGKIGMRLWFTIFSPDYDYSSEKVRSK
ncbi:MAG: fibronectin type III domain-containing protein [Dehalococcoidales bacterium]|nr:fibronectin type III domain-containing protein [Dehalococcoidales bacterium]